MGPVRRLNIKILAYHPGGFCNPLFFRWRRQSQQLFASVACRSHKPLCTAACRSKSSLCIRSISESTSCSSMRANDSRAEESSDAEFALIMGSKRSLCTSTLVSET